ncbi:hypothetical protein ACLI09_05375 [Flavobacterium sp. RHBU_24]|uniref:hypothetical protein n=1 Tax=Flavobacterium sp. RHBU_24 TaxID=3391185 RepID=UPI0039851BCA
MNLGNIIKRFYVYKRDIKNVWEEYNLINYSLLEVKNLQKNKSFTEPFERELLLASDKYPYKDYDIHLFIDRLTKQKMPQKSLTEAIAVTETYLQDLIAFVYQDYPLKVTHQNPDSPQSQLKLTHLIVSSNSREEIIDKLIEEKIRGIFYGNPVDFFLKDKAQIGFGIAFQNYVTAIDLYTEIVARRNIIIHNDNKVDSKYIREVKNCALTIGQQPLSDKEYVKKTVIILRSLAAISTKLVINNIYTHSISGKRIDKMAETGIKYFNSL